MLWALWPRWLAGKMLPFLGAVLVQNSKKKGPPWRHRWRETHPYYDLQVKVLRATNIRGTDLLSKADCYMQLWLPTASPSPAQTRIVANCSDPKWNETFHYQIHGAVKNVLEFTLYDKDIVGSDQLSQLLFDLRSLKCSQPHRHIFPLNDEVRPPVLAESPAGGREDQHRALLSSGSPRLKIQGMLQRDGTAPHQEFGSRQLQLAVPGVYEKPQLLPLKPPAEPGLPPIFTFHANPVLSSRLHVELTGQLSAVQSGPKELETQTSKLGEGGILLSSLPLGWEQQHSVALGEGQEVALSVKVEMSSVDLDLCLGFDLCDGEQEFLDRRKEVVSKALQQVLRLSEAPDSGQVPVVAVLGSGGGTRAISSLYGSLAGLQELGLLDTVTYLSGVSGSTWCISTFYRDPVWSQVALQGPIECAQVLVCSSKIGALSTEWLQYYTRELGVQECSGHSVSLIDLWDLLVEYFLYQEENPAKLSDQQEAVHQGQNPYPIYSNVNVCTNISGEDFAEWYEFTHYEIGFPKYGAYVPTELFGSEFFMRRLLQLQPEPRICYLQGVWDSAFAASLDEIFLKTAGSGLGFLEGYRGSVNITGEGSDSEPLPHHLAAIELWQRLLCSGIQLGPFSTGLLGIWWILCLPIEVDRVEGGGQRLAPAQALKMTEKYCLERGIPFPTIEVGPEDMEEARECYLFTKAEDPCSPIVLHFPLVNSTFCTHLAPGVERQTAEEKAFGDFIINRPDTPYGMMNFTYEPQDFDRLVALSRYNVLNNVKTFRCALQLALDQQKAREMVGG
uniref:Phospholipase A2 n=2 Tax=Callithrix jacchus TaxID=9483 RepID=H9KW03_CALJA